MPGYADLRPPGLSPTFRPGKTYTVTINWPAGYLAAHGVHTSTLDGQSLSVIEAADVTTIVLDDIVTAAAGLGQSDWIVFEDVDGTNEPIYIGTWTGDNKASSTDPLSIQAVLISGVTIDVSFLDGNSAAALASVAAAFEALPELASSDPAKVPLITAAGVTTIGVEKTVPEVAYLTADSAPVNNSGVPVDVTGLAVPVAANAVYMVTGLVFYTAHADADFKLQWTTPAGVSGTWALQGENTTTANAVTVIATTWASSRAVAGKDASTGAALMYGTLITGSTAGTLQAQFAQQTAHASDAIVKAHTLISVQRVD